MEVEIREAPRPFPVFSPGILGAINNNINGSVLGGRGAEGGALANGTTDAMAEEGGMEGGIGFGFVDSASLSPDTLFRTYVEREREGGRNVSEEVREMGGFYETDGQTSRPADK